MRCEEGVASGFVSIENGMWQESMTTTCISHGYVWSAHPLACQPPCVCVCVCVCACASMAIIEEARAVVTGRVVRVDDSVTLLSILAHVLSDPTDIWHVDHVQASRSNAGTRFGTSLDNEVVMQLEFEGKEISFKDCWPTDHETVRYVTQISHVFHCGLLLKTTATQHKSMSSVLMLWQRRRRIWCSLSSATCEQRKDFTLHKAEIFFQKVEPSYSTLY